MQNMDRRALLSFLGAASITPLLGLPESAARTAVVAQPGENRFAYSTDLATKSTPCKIASKDSNGTLSIFEALIPWHTGPPLHLHHREDEWFYVLAGDFVFEIGDDKFELPMGGSALGPRGIQHRWANTNKDDGKLIIVFQPGGFETFFDDLYKLVAKGGNIDPAEMRGLFAKHDQELLGPPVYAR
jgi:mannose-6-phosphate isomerase-like protein (cupin superfamily)